MQMQNNLLQKILIHKKLILAAVLPFSFWIWIFTFWFYGANPSSAEPIVVKSQNKNLDGLNISQLASANAQIDTDGDGLSDWEENVYGTDPKKSDTDGDNYLDGEEILSGHDPLKKGPNDLSAKKSNTDRESDTRTATAKFSKLTIENYLKTFKDISPSELSPDQVKTALMQSFDGDSSSQEFNEIIKSELYYFIPPNLDKDAKISNDNSKKSLDKYRTDFINTLNNIVKNSPQGDFAQTIQDSMKKNNFTDLDKFNNYHKTSYESIVSITVPSSLAANHKDYATRLYKLWKIGKAVESYEQDPAKALLALNELSNFVQMLKKEYAR